MKNFKKALLVAVAAVSVSGAVQAGVTEVPGKIAGWAWNGLGTVDADASAWQVWGDRGFRLAGVAATVYVAYETVRRLRAQKEAQAR